MYFYGLYDMLIMLCHALGVTAGLVICFAIGAFLGDKVRNLFNK